MSTPVNRSVRANPLPTAGSSRQAARNRTPPIMRNNPSRASALRTSASGCVNPALSYQGLSTIRPIHSRDLYLRQDLMTPRIEAVYKHLWLAGLPNAARPLHRQRLIGRSVLITEDPDEHLVWFENTIYVKPLPDYLLDYDYWNQHLCSDDGLYRSACGLLLSYIWLVRYQSDLAIATDMGLLSKDIAWPVWVEFSNVFLDNINLLTLGDVSKRYNYGELRLSRLNTIYRLAPPAFSLSGFIRGFSSGSTWYYAFFERHFKWMLAGFAVLAVLLSALQVGLATPKLQDNNRFQRASYGFTVASLLTIIVSAIIVLIVWTFLFWFHILSSWRHDRDTHRNRRAGIPAPTR